MQDLSPALSDAFLPSRAGATLVEVFAERLAASAARAFALAHLDPAKGPLIWVQDRLTRREAGDPYVPGIPGGFNIIRVDAGKPVDVLWAVEQALDCRALCGVLGEVWGEAQVVDFTATKRLALRAEAKGVACWLIRRAAQPNLSAARERWRLGMEPSLEHPDDDRAPGRPVWRAELFRARGRPTGEWSLSWDWRTRRMAVVDEADKWQPPVPQEAAEGEVNPLMSEG